MLIWAQHNRNVFCQAFYCVNDGENVEEEEFWSPALPFNIFVVAKIDYIFATTRFDLWMFKGTHGIFVFGI